MDQNYRAEVMARFQQLTPQEQAAVRQFRQSPIAGVIAKLFPEIAEVFPPVAGGAQQPGAAAEGDPRAAMMAAQMAKQGGMPPA